MPAQPGKFMKNWLLAWASFSECRFPCTDDASQQKVFKEDIFPPVNVVAGKPIPPVQLNKKNLQWKLFSSTDDDGVDLDTFYKGKDFVYAYALAEIKATKAINVMLGVGSDDGIKVWLNGKLVHDNWIPEA